MVDNVVVRAPYVTTSNEIRRLIVNACTVRNLSTSQISDTFLVPQRTVQRILKLFFDEEVTDKKRQGGHRTPM